MTRRPTRTTFAQRQAARERAHHRPQLICLGLLLLGCGAFSALILWAALTIPGGINTEADPQALAAGIATIAAMSLSGLMMGVLCFWAARP